MVKYKIQEKLSRYVFLFILFCMCGWIYEVILEFIYGRGFVNRGFLFGPYLPVYGVGILVLMVGLKKLMAKKIAVGKVSVTPIVVFLAIMIITSIIEYITGFLLELFFAQRFWDYSYYPMNLHGRICLSASLRFGVGGVVFLYLLIPVFSKWIDKIPIRIRKNGAVVIVLLLVLDLAWTLYSASQNGFNPILSQPPV